jgi:hypothetical protein
MARIGGKSSDGHQDGKRKQRPGRDAVHAENLQKNAY